MAGIKQIYRSPDAFRFPTYDEVISYPVNAVVAHYDSDTSTWNYYISKSNTTAGSLDSDIAFNEWTRFSFDSDTLAQYAQKALENNFNSLTAALDSDFGATLARLDSENDSDFRVFYAKVDSDLKELTKYVDSEIKLLNTVIHTDVDSDVLYLKTIVNNYVDEVKYGRLYDSEAILTETIDTRLTGMAIDAADARYVIATYLDQVQEQTPVTYRAFTSSVKDFSSSLFQNVNGAHKIAASLDSETLFGYFAPHAYVGSVSFRGVESGLGGGYFTSAYFEWKFTDGTILKEDQHLVALDNTTRITGYNPDITKKVESIRITAYNRSNDAPGINYLQINSAFTAPQLYAERANILHFAATSDMLRYDPHPDTIAFVRSTNTVFINEDSEWVAADPRYKYVDTTISNIERNFPPGALEDNTRALSTSNGYEYIVRSGYWVLDTRSVEGYDSDLVHNLDSDFVVLTQRYNAFNTVFWQNIEAFDDRLERNDSEIVTLQKGLMSFYKDYVALKQEHYRVHNDVDSDVDRWQRVYDATLVKYDNLFNTKADEDSDKLSQFLTAQDLANALLTTNIYSYTQAVKEDHDSDIQVQNQLILANSVDISLLRNGEVADNDSDIRALERRFDNHDSDYEYLKNIAMKYRGIVDITDSDDFPQISVIGDVYINRNKGTAVSLWGAALADETVPYGALLMFTADRGWTVINSGEGNTNFTADNVGVPAGTILTFPSQTAIPSSFHICDGSVYDPGLYSELYSILETNTLPDLRGYFLRGWSQDNSVDPDGPRAPLTVQGDENKSHNHDGGDHTHTYLDTQRSGTATVSGGAFGEEVTDDGTDFNYRTTSPSGAFLDSDGGPEARPKNVAVIYAIAMYSGAGSNYRYDSDLRKRMSEFDSDQTVLTHDFWATDSDFRVHLIEYADRDSDISDRISENDSEILVLQNTVATLVGQFNLVQNSELFEINVEGNITAGIEYDISSQVKGTATPEDFCYPDLQFFFATTGTSVSATAPGRRLDGTNSTPQISYRVIHTGANGALTVSMTSDTNISDDIRIVSTFRTQ